MSWIKRNLYFLIGSVVALGLLVWAGLYFFNQYKFNNDTKAKLNESYDTLKKLNTMTPNPGNDKVDNIKAAKEQQEELRAFITKAGKFFTRIPPIPDSPKVTDEEFAANLRKIIEQMQRDASNVGVSLPPRYDFSFSDIKRRITFAPGSLQPLSVQLGEVKTICDVLFRGKINSLDAIRRERVSMDDKELADYVERKSVTNEMAVLTPYEVTFRCFSPELASVMGGFAGSPHCIIVKSVSVEPAAGSSVPGETPGAPTAPVAPAYPIAPPPGANPYYQKQPGSPYGAPAPPPVVAPATASGAKSGPQIVLNEKVLKVTLWLEVVKLNEPAKSNRPAK